MARDFQGASNADEIEMGTWSVAGQALWCGVWVNPDSFGNDDRLFAKAQSTSSEDHVIMLSGYGTNEDELRFRLKTGTNDSSGTTTLFPTGDPMIVGQWQLCSVGYDGSNMRIWLDDLETVSTGKTGNMRINSWKFVIGNSPDNTGSGGPAFEGQMAFMVVFANSLTIQQITAMSRGINAFAFGLNLQANIPTWGNNSPEEDYSPQRRVTQVDGGPPRSTPNPPIEHMENYV